MFSASGGDCLERRGDKGEMRERERERERERGGGRGIAREKHRMIVRQIEGEREKHRGIDREK